MGEFYVDGSWTDSQIVFDAKAMFMHENRKKYPGLRKGCGFIVKEVKRRPVLGIKLMERFTKETKLTRSTFYNYLDFLKDIKVVKVVKGKYVWMGYQDQIVKAKDAIWKLRHVLLRDPTPDELASELRRNPREAEKLA